MALTITVESVDNKYNREKHMEYTLHGVPDHLSSTVCQHVSAAIARSLLDAERERMNDIVPKVCSCEEAA